MKDQYKEDVFQLDLNISVSNKQACLVAVDEYGSS